MERIKILFITLIASMLILSGCQQLPKVPNLQVNPNPMAVQQNVSLNTSQNTTANLTVEVLHSKLLPHPGNLTVYYFDVGQADSEFVIFPDGKTLLIDGGKDSNSQSLILKIRNLGVEKIDYVIASHLHDDHIGGLPYIFLKMNIGQVFYNGNFATTQSYNLFKQYAVNLTPVATDGIFDFSQNVMTSMYVPYDNGHGFSSNENDNSIIVRLTYGKESFLFTGDCEMDCEASVSNANLQSQVLKVAHHGSQTSSTLAFLSKVKPEVAVIEVGAGNSYGHPSDDTVQRFNYLSVPTYRTDINGDVVITTDGFAWGIG